MSPLLVAILGTYLIPLFIASWRISLLGLSCQGLLMGWMAYRVSPDIASANGLITLADLVLVRGLAVPFGLYWLLRSRNLPLRYDVISPNMLSWAMSVGIVFLAFNFSALLGEAPGGQRHVIAVVASGVMLGMLILASPAGVFSQMVGALYVENAIALFEHGGELRPEPVGLQLGQIAVVAMTFLLYLWYLGTIENATAADSLEALEGPTL